MNEHEENGARGVNTTVDDQEIASSNSGATAGASNVSTKVEPQKKLENKSFKAFGAKPDFLDGAHWEDAGDFFLTGITPAQLIGMDKAYWAKNRGNRK